MSDSANVVSQIVSPAPSEAPAENTAPVDTQAQSTPDEDPRLSSRFAALSRQEKHLQEQRAKLKEQEQELQRIQELKSKASDNPLELLQHFGLSLDDLIIKSLGDAAPPPTVESTVEQLRKEIEDFKAAQQKEKEDQLKEIEQKNQNSIDEAIASHQLAIESLLSENVAKYELIHLHDAQELVWEVTEAHFETHGTVLSPDAAADKVEAFLEAKVKKAMDLERFKAQSTPQPTETDQGFFKAEQVNPTAPVNSRTLTAEMVTSSAPTETPNSFDLEESKRRAAALLKWK